MMGIGLLVSKTGEGDSMTAMTEDTKNRGLEATETIGYHLDRVGVLES